MEFDGMSAEMRLDVTEDVQVPNDGAVKNLYDDEALVAANFVKHFAFQNRFGVLKPSDHQVVVYCNMGGSGREHQLLVRLREVAADVGWRVTGSSFCGEGYSWAVVLHGWDAAGGGIEEDDVVGVFRPLIKEVWSAHPTKQD